MTWNRTHRYLITMLISILTTSTNLSGQTINFSVPNDFVVCQNDQFQVLITNNTGVDLENISLEVYLPCQVEYVPGTIQNGIASNISNLNSPIFNLPNIAIGGNITVSMELHAPCSNIGCIDNGDLFSNAIKLNSNQGSLERTSALYQLETALPLITRIEDPIIKGIKGQTVKRKITIKNTRPGFLDSLIFSDNFGAGISILADQGEVLSHTNSEFRLLLSANDFKKIGDGDGLFEFNEELILTESIKIDACGFEISAVRSKMNVEWGCNGVFCSSPFQAQTALIDLEYKIKEGPILEFIPEAIHPTCLCGEFPVRQSLTIENFDANHSASEVVVSIDTEQFRGSAFPHRNIRLTSSSGVDMLIETGFVKEISWSCSSDSFNLHPIAYVTIPKILPGEIVELSWDVYFCNTEPCYDAIYQYVVNYNYIKDCTLDHDDYFVGSEFVQANIPYVITSELEPGSGFEYLETQTVDYILQSPFFTQQSGSLDIELDFPCHLEVVESEWNLSGVQPSSIQVEDEGAETKVILSYPLPLPVDSVVLAIDVQFVCLDRCEGEICEESYISTCPGICSSDALVFSINALAEMNFEECNNLCPAQSCQFQIYFYDCDLPYCEIYVPGYLSADFEMYRLSRGLPDNDNDHFPDSSGELNEDLIRLDHAITGDTIRMAVTGEIIIDIPGESFTKGLIDLNMKLIKSEGIDLNFQSHEFVKFVDSDIGLIPIKRELRIIDASTGNEYICSEVPFLYTGGAGDRSFDIDIENMISNGCSLPVDYKYEHGDSLYFVADFFINYNIKSLLLNYGSLDIEFLNINTMYEGELGNRDDLYSCGCPTEIMKFANYKTAVTKNGTFIDCCYGEGAGGDFKVLKYGTFTDFFPYEYKPPLELKNLLMPKIEGLEITSATIVNLKSNGKNFIVDPNDPATYIQLNLDNISQDTTEFVLVEDISGYYIIQLTQDLPVSWDENLEFRIEFEYRNQNCTFIGSQNYDGTQEIDFSSGILLTDYTRDLEHGVALVGKQSRINTFINLCNVTSFSNELSWEIGLESSMFNNQLLDNAIHNVWFYPENKNGTLTDFSIVNRDSGHPYDQINGIFQLDSIPDGDTLYITLKAISSSCQREEIIFHLGWDCQPFQNINDASCFRDIRTCFGQAPPGVVDMITNSSILEALLCDTMPYTEVYIFNAGLGPIVDLNFSAKLPPGLRYASGSAQIEFESGSQNFIAIPDPIVTAQGELFWKIDDYIVDIQTEGLQGIGASPLNGLNLRFKTISDCDFISGSRIVYNISAERICDEPGNTVSKFSDPLHIKDVSTPYLAHLSVSSDISESCGDLVDISVQFIADQPTGLLDNIVMQLPQGLSYVLESCSGDLIDCVPTTNNGLLIWHLPEGQKEINFSFQIKGAHALACGEVLIPINSTSEVNAICIVDGSNCSLKVSTSELIFPIQLERPIFEFNSIEIQVDANNISLSDLTINISNIADVDADGVTFSLYLDKDASGNLTAADELIGDYYFSDEIQSLQSISLLISGLDLSFDALCQLIITIEDDHNCVCNEAEQVFDIPIVIDYNIPQIICSGDSIPIGISQTQGHSYIWSTSENLSCGNCPSTIFTAENEGFQTELYELMLTDLNAESCAVHYNFNIEVNPLPGIWSDNFEICAGQELDLLASSDATYNWEGEGIIDPALQAQTVSPSEDAQYIVTITNSLGCAVVDTADVVVHPLPIANAGPDILACYGQEISIFAENVNPDYSYFWIPGIPYLDDPESYNPTVLISQPQTFVLEVDDGHCEASDTIVVSYYDGFDSTTPDSVSVCYGDPVEVFLNPENAYNWAPFFSGMCQDSDCSHVLFTPENSLSVTVIAQNIDGCLDTSSIEIIVIDPGLPETTPLQICEGEELHIYGITVTEEGLYCDTIMYEIGCSLVQCTDLSYYPTSNVMITASDSIVSPGTSVQLEATSGFTIYSWDPSASLSCLDCPDPIISVEEEEEFVVTVTDENGCTAKAQIRIEVREICDVEDVLIPNAFTANGNNINDRFRVANVLNRAIGVNIEVYDRWGELLYEGQDNSGWDGSHEGEDVPEGVYLYIIRVDCGDGNDKLYKGNVTLIR